jgi:hypothetical protein
MKQKDPLCFYFGSVHDACCLQVVHQSKKPITKRKKINLESPPHQSSNRYGNIYFNIPLKLKQTYYGSRGKKGVIDVMNFLCAQLYLLLNCVKATLEASSVNERRWSSIRYYPTWGQPYGQSRVLMRLFFLPILRYISAPHVTES